MRIGSFGPVLVAGATLLGATLGDSVGVHKTVPQSLVLSETPRLNVTWWVESEVADVDEELVFIVEAETEGWWGVGLNSKGDMSGADIVLGKVNDEGHLLFDCHATGRMLPIKDDSQDYEVLSAQLVGGVQTVQFKRNLDTCDMKDFNGAKGTARMIWAFPQGSASSSFPTGAHASTRRGAASVQLRTAPIMGGPDEGSKNAFDLEFLMDNVSVPEYPAGGFGHGPGTTYWCKTFTLSEETFSDKHHILAFKPKIDPAHLGRVHHMLMYECPEIALHEQKEYDGLCYTGEDMPEYVNGCNGGKVVLGWAVGAETQHFPDAAGYPIGGSHARHFLLETHYDNPAGRDAFVDSSGMIAVVTTDLRDHDAGAMQIGHEVNPSMTVPPLRDHHNVHGWCAGECTGRDLEDDIVIFGAQLHAHTVGRRIAARHFRDGIELEPLAVDNTYDFNYQMMTPLSPPRNVSPGDAMLTTCTYDSSDRAYVTTGGLSTASEMCLTYLWYYPAENGFNECKSRMEDGVVVSRNDEGWCGDGNPVDLPWGWTGYEYDTQCIGATKQCGDGIIDRDMGEQCDDGNRVQGDGCDPYCFTENSHVCYSKEQVPFAENDYECISRASVAAAPDFAVQECSTEKVSSIVGEILPKVTEILQGADVVVGACTKGLTSCNPENPQFDSACRNYLIEVSRLFKCCAEGDVKTGYEFVTGRLDEVIGPFCGAPLPLEAHCDFCGDGSVNPVEAFEECDDGNDQDGDGCSASCRVEARHSCVTVNGFSVCGEAASARDGELSSAPYAHPSPVTLAHLLISLLVLNVFR